MAWQITKRVWDSASHLKTTEKLMLLALAEHADEAGVCWPAYDTLARMTGVNRRSAIRVVAALETRGAIWVRAGAGRGRANRYLVAVGLDQEQIAHILHTHPALKLSLPAALTAAAAVSHRQPGVAKGANHNTVYPASADQKVSFPTGNSVIPDPNGVIPGQNGAGPDTLCPVEKVLSVTKNYLVTTLNGVKSGPNGVSGNTRTIEPSTNQKESLITGPTQTGLTLTSPAQTDLISTSQSPIIATSTDSNPAGSALTSLVQTGLTAASPVQIDSSPVCPTLTDTSPTGPTPPPPAGKRAAPAAPRPSAYQPLVEALAAACRYDLDLISRAERAELERDARKMADLGYTPADLEGFGRWWYQTDWRGKQNQAPTLKNVRTMLSQFKQKGTSNAQNHPNRPTRAAGLGQWSPDELASLRGPAGRA